MSTIKTLFLENYRNHAGVKLIFGDRINLIVGGNAMGKTNILESIFLLGRGKSFRPGVNKDVIMWGESFCCVGADFKKECGMSSASININENEKDIKVDGKKKRKTGIHIVLFTPADITIFRDLPAKRRDSIDDFISSVDDVYSTALRTYEKSLSHRNSILKAMMEPSSSSSSFELNVWSDRVIETGTELMVRRKKWIDKIDVVVKEVYGEMGGVGEIPSVVYCPNIPVAGFGVDEVKAAFGAQMEKRMELDKIRGTTNSGPHRDDWRANIDDKDAAFFASQGQMRMLSISIKVAEMKIINKVFGESPMLLLDDVVSELDENSRRKLLEFVNSNNGQVFITATDQGLIEKHIPEEMKIFSVSADGIRGE